jgi:hypothetical protein
MHEVNKVMLVNEYCCKKFHGKHIKGMKKLMISYSIGFKLFVFKKFIKKIIKRILLEMAINKQIKWQKKAGKK